MGTGIPDIKGMEIPMAIWELEKAIDVLPWYSFIKRSRLKHMLSDTRVEAFGIGMRIAFEELEKAGILQRVKE